MLSGGLRTKDIIKQSQENYPLITVITVVRNAEETIEKTILSVVNQTYNNVEYIIVDGASTDNTLDIVRKYEDKIDYWISEPDNGIYDAMNKGIDLATGDWINFMNGGDSFYSSEVILEILKNISEKIDVIYGNVCFNNNLIKKSCLNINYFYFMFGGMICHQTIFIRNKIFLSRKFNSEYKIYADKDFLIYLLMNKYKFKYISCIICNYDTHGVSSKKNIYTNEHFIIIKKYYGYIGYYLALLKYLSAKLIKTMIFLRNE